MVNNKLLISYGGIVALLPAKPFLTLAAVGAVTVCVVGYWFFIEDEEE